MSLFNNYCCCSTITCTKINGCVNRELVEIESGLDSDLLPNFCGAVNNCVNSQLELISQGLSSTLTNFEPALFYLLRDLPGYTDTGEIFLSLNNDVFTWQTVSGSGSSYTDEQAQDAVGNIFTNTASISFSYNDTTPSISANVSTAFVRNLFGAGAGLSYNSSTGVFTSTATAYTDEQAQDAVGTILSTEFTYNDATPSISLNVGSGLSKTNIVRLGQIVGTVGNPAALLSNTEVPLGDYNFIFNNKTGIGVNQSSITFKTGNSLGYNLATVNFEAKDYAGFSFFVDNSAGNIENVYITQSSTIQGYSGYRLSGVGGNFYLSDMRGNTTHTSVEVGGLATQRWLVNGDTQIGLFGTKNTGFGGVINPLSHVHIIGSTSLTTPLVFDDGLDPISNYIEGGVWRTNNHLYARLNGQNKQLDNDYNFTPDSFIQNQFSTPQTSANFWIDGHGRIDDYLQIESGGRFSEDTTPGVRLTLPTDTITGTDLRLRRLTFFTTAFTPPELPYQAGSASYIDSNQGDHIGLHAPGDFGNIAIDSAFVSQGRRVQWNSGGFYPLVIRGADSDSLDPLGQTDDYLRMYAAVPAASLTKIGLSFTSNRENGTPIDAIFNRGDLQHFARVSAQVVDVGQSSYKGDLLFETVDSSINSGSYTEYLRVKHDGRLIVKSLDTDGTAPTTTGITKMVVCDSTGLLSFDDIPVGGSGSSALSDITAALATNNIDNSGFLQRWRWDSLVNGSPFRITSSSTIQTGESRLISSEFSGINSNSSIQSTNFYALNTKSGTSSTNKGFHGIFTGGATTVFGAHLELYTTGTINYGIYSHVIGAATNYSLYLDGGSVLMNSLPNASSQDRLIGQTASTKILGYITIGAGLSLTGGVLTASATGGNIYNTDGSLTNTRTVNMAGFGLSFTNNDEFIVYGEGSNASVPLLRIVGSTGIVELGDPTGVSLNTVGVIIDDSGSELTLINNSTTNTFFKIADYGTATAGDVLVLVDETTGEVGWAANGVGGGGSVTSFSSGDLSPLFTTNVTNSTSTPALAFTLSSAGANTWFGNNTGGATTPAFNAAGTVSKVDDTNVTLTLTGAPTNSVLNSFGLTVGWTGTLGVVRGGTNISSYSVGDLIYASGATTLSKLAIGTNGQLLRVNAGATALEYFTPTYISSAVVTLNTLTAATQTFAAGSSGSDFNISSATSTHTFNIPSAALAATRGLITNSAQTIGGVKTFDVGVVINESGVDSDFRVESDNNINAIVVDASTDRVGIFTGAPAHPLDITGNTRILSGGLGIGTAPSTASPLVIGGSGWTSSGIILVPSISASAGSSPSIIGVTGTIVEAASGVHTIISSVNISAPTITSGAATVTDAATLYIGGAPTATVTGGVYALLVGAGNTQLNGDLTITNNNYSTGGYRIAVRNEATGRIETVEPDVVSLNSQSGTSYALALTDKGGMVRMNNASANTLTVPTNASVAFSIGTQILIYQEGAGQTTVSPAGGVTISSSDSATKLRVQHSVATLIKIATNTWVLSGDITT